MLLVELDDNRQHKFNGQGFNWLVQDGCIIITAILPGPQKQVGPDGKEVEITQVPIAVFPVAHMRFFKVLPEENKGSGEEPRLFTPGHGLPPRFKAPG